MKKTTQQGYRTLALEGLQLLTSLGILPEEINQPQPIEVNVDLNLGERHLIPERDAMDEVLDYRRVREVIITTCTAGHVNLLETLIGKVTAELLTLPGVLGVRVCMTKLEVFDDCAVTVQMEAGDW
ncbi:MAG: dihydroneopterin aldolase [Saezia sp.]